MTSDSLAADSLNQGGSFAAGNSGAAASSQPSKGSTASNTDTSGATPLNAAPDAEARQASEGWNESQQLNAGKGLGKESGAGPTYATAAGGNSSSDSGFSKAGNVPKSMPGGRNITEGGFDDGAPNASFNDDIGGKNDPGRAAVGKMISSTAQAGGDAGAGPRQGGITNDGQFDALGETDA